MSPNFTPSNPGESSIPLDEKNQIKQEEKKNLADKLLSSNEEINEIISNPEKAKAISALKRDFKKIRYGLDADYDEVPSMSKDVDYVKTGNELVWEVLSDKNTNPKVCNIFESALRAAMHKIGAQAEYNVYHPYNDYLNSKAKGNALEMIQSLNKVFLEVNDYKPGDHNDEGKRSGSRIEDDRYTPNFPSLLRLLSEKGVTEEDIVNAIAKIYLEDIEAIRKK